VRPLNSSLKTFLVSFPWYNCGLLPREDAIVVALPFFLLSFWRGGRILKMEALLPINFVDFPFPLPILQPVTGVLLSCRWVRPCPVFSPVSQRLQLFIPPRNHGRRLTLVLETPRLPPLGCLLLLFKRKSGESDDSCPFHRPP